MNNVYKTYLIAISVSLVSIVLVIVTWNKAANPTDMRAIRNFILSENESIWNDDEMVLIANSSNTVQEILGEYWYRRNSLELTNVYKIDEVLNKDEFLPDGLTYCGQYTRMNLRLAGAYDVLLSIEQDDYESKCEMYEWIIIYRGVLSECWFDKMFYRYAAVAGFVLSVIAVMSVLYFVSYVYRDYRSRFKK